MGEGSVLWMPREALELRALSAHPARPAALALPPSRLSSYGERQLLWLDRQLSEGRHTVVMVSAGQEREGRGVQSSTHAHACCCWLRT